MKRALSVATILTAVAGAALVGQSVPDDAPALRVPPGFRRPATIGFDPFRYVSMPKWGLVITTGAAGGNNALNLEDLGAITYLYDRDEFRAGEIVDALTLIPEGQGLLGSGQVEGGAYLGVSLGRRLTVGVSASGHAYARFVVDDDAVALLRDGNGARQDFSLGQSDGTLISTGDVGLHSVFRTGPLGSSDGMDLQLGFGLRYVRPAMYARARSALDNGGVLRVTGDSIQANLAVELVSTIPTDDATDDAWSNIRSRLGGDFGGGSMAMDLMVRAEWPTAGFALEGMLVNVGGSVDFMAAARRVDTLMVQTTSIDDVREELDLLDFDVRDSVDVSVGLPRIWRLTASSWANRILQIDLSAFGTAGGDLTMPFTVDVGTTWRLVRQLPLRAGVVVGGQQGIGYTGGFGFETSNMLFRVSGQSLGGWFRTATGFGGRVDFGLFF